MKLSRVIAEHRKQQKWDMDARNDCILEWMKLVFILMLLTLALLLGG